MITPSLAAHKVSKAQNLVTIWSPWWHVYLTRCDFSYVYDETLSIMGSSSLVMTVGMEFIQSHNLMEIAISLEFALQQALRSMDTRAQHYIEDHPSIRRDVVGLGQSLEINDDINNKFSSVPDYLWLDIATRIIDKSYLSSYNATKPPHLPQGWFIPQDFGFESGLSAEKYIQMLVEKNEQEEEEYLNQESDDSTGSFQGGNEESDFSYKDEGQESDQRESTSSSENDFDLSGDEENGNSDSFSPPIAQTKGEGKSSQTQPGEDPGQSLSLNEDQSLPNSNGDNESVANASQSVLGGTQRKEKDINDTMPSTGDNNPSGGNVEQDLSSSIQAPSPFREDYSMQEYSNPSIPQEHLRGEPAPINSNPQQIDLDGSMGEDGDKGESGTKESFNEESGDLSLLEGSIVQSYDNIHNNIPQRTESPEESQSISQKSDSEINKDIENPWDHSDLDPSGNTDPNPQDESMSSQQDAMAGIEAELANQMNDSAPKGTQEDHNKLIQDYEHLMDRAKESVGKGGEHNFDIPQHSQDSSAVGVSAEEKEDINKELAESISEYNESIPRNGGFTAGDSFIAWSNEKLRKPVVPWQKVLRKIVSLSVSRSQMSGQSDLSYAKQNPNQQPDMPIMMGFVTYPPEVTVLVDASPSMIQRRSKVISEFAGVIQKILIQYSQPVVMAAADNSVKYVAYSISPAKSIIKNVGKTFDGSSAKFGDTVARVAKKGVKFRGRNYPSPDVLILFTDCLFRWPFEESSHLPHSYATVIVASTEPYDKVKDYLPRWVKEKKNFVHIRD